MEILIWLGIAFCALKAATFSGLNLAYFSVPVLRLKILAKQKDPEAIKVLKLRSQPNFLLATILWANVSYNVLLALLANSVMAGLTSFFFSTVILTLVGEILPQATFSRRALKFGAFFAPMIRFYQLLLYPVTRSTAWMLDRFLGEETPRYFSEKDLIALIEEHLVTNKPLDISATEGRGAIEFLKLDDRLMPSVGQPVLPEQCIVLPFSSGRLRKIEYEIKPSDPFLQKLCECEAELMVLLDESNNPQMVLAINPFLKAVFATQARVKIRDYCIKPVIVTDPKATVSTILKRFTKAAAVDKNLPAVALYWQGRNRKILTGDDLMALLLP